MAYATRADLYRLGLREGALEGISTDNQDAAIEAAQAPYLARIALVCEANTDAFPGSRAWTAAQNASAKLAAFDAAHPEILASVQAAHAAEMTSRYQD